MKQRDRVHDLGKEEEMVYLQNMRGISRDEKLVGSEAITGRKLDDIAGASGRCMSEVGDERDGINKLEN